MKTKLIACFAALVATLGIYAIGQTMSDTIARDVTPWYGEDQSNYPDQNNRSGTIVRTYRFDTHGGAIGDTELGADLPDGIMVIGGVIDVHTAMSPTNGTCGLEIGTADILATGSTLESTGQKAIVPVWTVGSSVVTANATSPVTLDIAGTAYTNGAFTVILDVIQLNP